MASRISRFFDNDTMQRALAKRVAGELREAIDQRGKASIALSGGKTPIPFLKFLSQEELNWDRVFITLADERWVNPESEDSNEKLVRDHLMKGPAASAKLIGLWSDFKSPEEGLPTCKAHLEELPGQLDLVILGMGLDGHTLSWFPCAENFEEVLDPSNDSSCASVRPKSAPHPRMSMTYSYVLKSRRAILEISGQKKLEILESATAQKDPHEFPISALLHQTQLPFETYWAP